MYSMLKRNQPKCITQLCNSFDEENQKPTKQEKDKSNAVHFLLLNTTEQPQILNCFTHLPPGVLFSTQIMVVNACKVIQLQIFSLSVLSTNRNNKSNAELSEVLGWFCPQSWLTAVQECENVTWPALALKIVLFSVPSNSLSMLAHRQKPSQQSNEIWNRKLL